MRGTIVLPGKETLEYFLKSFAHFDISYSFNSNILAFPIDNPRFLLVVLVNLLAVTLSWHFLHTNIDHSLITACETGDLAEVKKLLEQAADLNVRLVE